MDTGGGLCEALAAGAVDVSRLLPGALEALVVACGRPPLVVASPGALGVLLVGATVGALAVGASVMAAALPGWRGLRRG